MRYSREWKRAYHVTWCVLWPAHNGHEAWFRFSRCGITWPQVARKIGVRYWRGMHVCTAVCLDIRKNALTDIAPNAKVVPPPPPLVRLLHGWMHRIVIAEQSISDSTKDSSPLFSAPCFPSFIPFSLPPCVIRLFSSLPPRTFVLLIFLAIFLLWFVVSSILTEFSRGIFVRSSIIHQFLLF